MSLSKSHTHHSIKYRNKKPTEDVTSNHTLQLKTN